VRELSPAQAKEFLVLARQAGDKALYLRFVYKPFNYPFFGETEVAKYIK
jgi:hypothetical protein